MILKEQWLIVTEKKDSKGQRKMEDSGGGLLPAVEGHSLE